MKPPPVKFPLLSSIPRYSKNGFTLIELLMVIAVIVILAGITFGISRGVQNAQARAQAKAELMTISQALEQFKSSNGDYPWTEQGVDASEANAVVLLNALLGWKEFKRTGGSVDFVDVLPGDVPASGPNEFLDPSKFSIRRMGSDEEYVDLPDTSSTAPSGYYLVDPWGRPYVYVYGKKSGASNTWEVFGYHLYSMGLDKMQNVSAINSSTGEMDSNFREIGAGENIDNIYVGE